MATLTVRNLDDAVVRRLRIRAAEHGRSAEAEHREILKAALHGPRRRRLADVLMEIPGVGEDGDFTREQRDRRS